MRTVALLVPYPASHADLGATPMLSRLVKLLQSTNPQIAADVPQVRMCAGGGYKEVGQ